MKKFKVFILLVLILSTNISASATTKLEEIEQAISKQKEDLKSLQTELNSLNSELKNMENQIATIEQNIETTKIQNETVKDEIIELENKIEEQKDHNRQMIVNLQVINHETNIVSVLFSKDGASPISSAYALELLIDEITKDINGSVDVKNEMLKRKQLLENSSKKLEEDLLLVESKKRELDEKKTSLVKKQNESYEASDNLNRELVKLEEEKKIQIELAYSEDAYIANADKEKLMKEAGINEEDYPDVDYIIFRESSWNYKATNPESDAYGLCQALPAEKMEAAGSDWQTNPVTQLKWCNGYAVGRYGSWQAGKEFWIENHWW